jgi:hypothetical protein
MITTIFIAAGYAASVALSRDAASVATRALLGRGRTHAGL